MKKCYDLTEQPDNITEFVKEFLSLSDLRVYVPGELLYRQNTVLQSFWLILEGYAETYTSSTNGTIKHHGILGPYTLAGMSSLSGYKGHTELRAKTRLLAAVMPKENVCLWSREMLLSVVRIQTGKYRNAQRQLLSFHSENTSSRIARLLLEIGNPYRYNVDGSIPSLCIFTVKEIAQHVNSTASRVSQILHEMDGTGAVRLSEKNIIFYPNKLKEYLES